MKTKQHSQRKSAGAFVALAALLAACGTTVEEPRASGPESPGATAAGVEAQSPKQLGGSAVAPVQELKIVAIAAERLASYLADIPQGDEADFGFTDRNEFALARLGAPYELFRAEENGDTTPLNQWSVPVLVDDEMRALMEVKLESDGGYTVYAFGSARLATELGNVEAARSASGATPAKSKAILRSFIHSADFVAFDTDLRAPEGKRDLKVRALQSAQTAFDGKLKRLTDVTRSQDVRAPIDATTFKALVGR